MSLVSNCRRVASTCGLFHLRRAARAVTQLYDQALAPCGIRATQFNVLVAAELAEGAALGRLAELLGMDRTTLTRNLEPLRQQGLVEMVGDRDRRHHRVQLTAAGRDRVQQAMPHWEQAQAQLVAAFGEDSWPEFLSELKTAAATDAGEGATRSG